MGEGTHGVDDPSKRVEEIEQHIDGTREELSVLLSELDRRRREALDFRHQLKQRIFPVVVGGILVVGAVGAWVVYLVRERRYERRLPVRARRLRSAVGRAVRRPERVAAGDPTIRQKIAFKIVTAAGTAAATGLLRALAERSIRKPIRGLRGRRAGRQEEARVLH